MFLRSRHSPWVRLALVLGAMGLFVLGYQWGNEYQRRHAKPPQISGVLVRPPAAIPGFRLEDPLGRAFDQDTLGAGWTLLTFGDLSGVEGQLAIQRLLDVYNRVADEEGLHRYLRLVLVTTTDAPNLARDFARLSPALYVLSGDAAELQRLRAALGVGPEAEQPLFVFAPGGYLVALLTGRSDGAGLAADLRALHQGLHALLAEGT
ncbi:MAG: SCO family protein [Bdellovibrio bacteriovorus]